MSFVWFRARPLLAALAAFALAPAALAATAARPLGAEDQALVARAVAYLDGLTSDRGRFVQTDARGEQTSGTFVLQRPGRARFDYDPPSGLTIASNGFKVTVVDRRLKTIESYPLGATPLGLFLARHIHLDRGVAVTAVSRSAHGFTITAQNAGKPNQGSIALDFSDPPLRLAGWTVINAQGQGVRVALSDFAPAAPLDHARFELADPARPPAGGR